MPLGAQAAPTHPSSPPQGPTEEDDFPRSTSRHLNWRTPPSYAELYPAASVALPAQRTLDPSIWAGAYTLFPMAAPGGANGSSATTDFVTSPYVSGTDAQLRDGGVENSRLPSLRTAPPLPPWTIEFG